MSSSNKKSNDSFNMHSPDLIDQNIDKLAGIFPNCITESLDANGQLQSSVDFDLLRQELSRKLVEGGQERYRLDWPGKRQAILEANTPIAKTLRPVREESVNFDTTENLFIEGDNLEALKLLQESYLGKVKMIYIDPPYNTGNDFIYRDNYKEDQSKYDLRANIRDSEGYLLTSTSENSGRIHSNWLSMMYSRIKLSKNLLSEDGLIFISIDDNEYANLKKICDETYGAHNLVTTFIWKSRQNVDSRNKSNVSIDHEYILVYSKNIQNIKLRGKQIDLSKYSNPDNDPRGPWMSNSILGLANSSQRPNLHYVLVEPSTGREFHCPEDSGWRFSKETMASKIEEGRIVFPKNDDGRPREKKYLNEKDNIYTGYSSLLPISTTGYTLNGTREVRELFDEKVFDFPKPISLINELLEQLDPTDNDIVLDFFAGSASTAHSIFEFNIKNGREVKFILVQIDSINEINNPTFKSIAEISKERIRRAGQKIIEDNKDKEGIEDLDIGFRVLKIDSTNMKEVYYTPDEYSQAQLDNLESHIKEDRTAEDLLFQVMLDWGVPLSLPIEVKKIQGHPIYYVGFNSLVACFDTLTTELVNEIAKDEPLKFVTSERAISHDQDKTNIKARFAQLSPDTDVRFI